MNPSKPFEDVAIRMYQDDPALAADMLHACLEDGDIEEFLFALRQIEKSGKAARLLRFQPIKSKQTIFPARKARP